MANSTPFDGTNFLPDAPDQGQPHGNDFREHQSTRKSMQLINNKEHESIATDPSASSGGGVHLNGSSVAYFTSTEPVNRPDTSTALADNDIDKGRVWFDSNVDPPAMMKWNGSAWVAALVLPNDTSLRGVNQAGDGTVELVKVNTDDNAEVVGVAGNEADGQGTPKTTGYQICDIDGSPIKVYTKYITDVAGTRPASFAHGITDFDNILSVTVSIFNVSTSNYQLSGWHDSPDVNSGTLYYYDSTDIIIEYGLSIPTSAKIRIKIEYTL